MVADSVIIERWVYRIRYVMGINDFLSGLSAKDILWGKKKEWERFLGVYWCDEDLILERHRMRGHSYIQMLKGSKRISGCNITDKVLCVEKGVSIVEIKHVLANIHTKS